MKTSLNLSKQFFCAYRTLVEDDAFIIWNGQLDIALKKAVEESQDEISDCFHFSAGRVGTKCLELEDLENYAIAYHLIVPSGNLNKSRFLISSNYANRVLKNYSDSKEMKTLVGKMLEYLK